MMRSLTLPILLTGVLSLATAGCDSGTDQSRAASIPITVAVVGDETASIVIEELTKQGVKTVATLDEQAQASLIVVVQDATVGPMPIHLEIAKLLEKRPTETFIWVFTNTAMVDDQELLELEELECREIFTSQGLPGDHIVFGFDSSNALVSPTYDCPKGWTAIVQHIRNVAR